MEASVYEGREQAYVKHFVLAKYLETLALKVGQFQWRHGTTLNYIDGFSGPWKTQDDDARDSSPILAITELLKAKAALAARDIRFTPRCMFVEENRTAYDRLVALSKQYPEVEVHARHGDFESCIGEAVRFAKAGRAPFAFVFLDPTGWTGFPLKAITPLLNVRRSEVLINFMLEHIGRFIDGETFNAAPSFEGLFGQKSEEYRLAWSGLRKADRADEIVRAYRERIRSVGSFEYSGSAVVLNRQIDRPHYHLVYATRSLPGLIAFRETERAAMEEQKQTRAAVKAAAREEQTQQLALFDPVQSDTPYADDLRARYHQRSSRSVLNLLERAEVALYDDLVAEALSFPMCSEHDLKDWLKGWPTKLENLSAHDRTPKVKKNHRVRLLK
jgi:three-Cys-motif partner protein